MWWWDVQAAFMNQFNFLTYLRHFLYRDNRYEAAKRANQGQPCFY